MALLGYNSKEGHEEPSLLDTIFGLVNSSWEEGTNWIEEQGTDFLESFPQADVNDPNMLQESVDNVFNTMGGGLGTIAKNVGSKVLGGTKVMTKSHGNVGRRPDVKFTNEATAKQVADARVMDRPIGNFGSVNNRGWSTPAQQEAKKAAGIQRRAIEDAASKNDVIGEALRKLDKGTVPGQQPFNRPGGGLAKQADAKLVAAKEGFAFNKGFDPIAYMKEAKTPNQVMASWDKIRHQMSNYETLGKGLNYKQHEAWAKEMYTMFADALKSQGMPTHAKIIMHQLSQRGNKVKQSYNSAVK